MGRLLYVEVRRLLSRRAARLLFLALVAGMFVLDGVQFAQSSGRPPEIVVIEQELRTPSGEIVPGHGSAQYVRDKNYRMTEEAPGQVKAVGIIASIFAFMVGTSFIGAEWAAGTLQALLFWEPRRARVLLAKMAALAGVTAAVSFVLQLVQLGLLYLTADLRGTLAGATGPFYREMIWTSGRLAGLAVFTGLLAFAIAGLTRHTAAALGVAFAYFAVLENVLRGFRPGWSRFLISSQFAALVEKRLLLHMPSRVTSEGFFEGKAFVLTMGRATLTLIVYLAIALAAMTVLFVRRDVT